MIGGKQFAVEELARALDEIKEAIADCIEQKTLTSAPIGGSYVQSIAFCEQENGALYDLLIPCPEL